MPRRPDLPPLRRSELHEDPAAQFAAWYERALAEVPLAEAMTLATVDAEGRPDARVVLLKGFDADGLRFFSNYGSAKASQLDACGHAAVVVYWRELDRQVRARGPIERLSAEESDAYFATRPRDSQLGAWASPQSSAISDRAQLDDAVREAEARFADGEVPRPPHWGGYLLRPDSIEFWQGQVGRLHDRFRYARDGSGWRIERLAP
ncbi:MAG: pyridoxamine 5'-phosphate oxidase [bacterium]